MEHQSVTKSRPFNRAPWRIAQPIRETGISTPRPARQINRIRELFAALLTGYQGRATIRLWDGAWVAGKADAPTTVVLRQPAVVRRLLVSRDLLSLGEAFLAGDIDIDGPIEGAFDLVDYLDSHTLGLGARGLAGTGAAGALSGAEYTGPESETIGTPQLPGEHRSSL